MRDVVIVGRDDCSTIVNLRARDQQTARLQLLQMFWKRIRARRFLLRPQTPIGLGAIQHALWSFFANLLVQCVHFVVTFSGRDPIHARLTAVGSKRKLETNRTVHATLRNAVAAQHAVLGVAPCSFRLANSFGARGIGGHANSSWMTSIEQKIEIVFVMNQAASLRIKGNGVAHGAFIHA